MRRGEILGLRWDDIGPERISPPVLFLASDLAADITGKILGVQGRRVFEYKVVTSDGAAADEGQSWTPQMIKERWPEICVKN